MHQNLYILRRHQNSEASVKSVGQFNGELCVRRLLLSLALFIVLVYSSNLRTRKNMKVTHILS